MCGYAHCLLMSTYFTGSVSAEWVGCSQTKTRPFMGVLVNVQFKHIDVTLVEFSQKLIFTNDMKGETMMTGCIISFGRTGMLISAS